MKNNIAIMSLLSFFLLSPVFAFAQEGNGLAASSETGYIGTYTRTEGHVDGKADGIYRISRNTRTGKLQLGSNVAELTNPSFVKLSPDGKYLYAVSELGPADGASGYVHTFKIKPDSSLEEIGKVPSRGYAPCHIATDSSGEFVFVSNYSSGTMLMLQKQADGTLKEKQVLSFENKEASHPHSVTLSVDNRHAYIADLGNDKVYIYDFDAKEGSLTPNSQPFVALEKGAGPRHFTFSKDNCYAYTMNELNNTVSGFKVLDGGGLEKIQTLSSLPESFSGESHGADIHLHPSGKFLYVSNRGHNSIAAFEVNRSSGQLNPAGFTDTQGDFPRNFAISDDGKFLYVANQNTSDISSYSINSQTGELEPLREPLEVKTPVCIEFE